MKKAFRVISVLLLVVMLASMLAACQDTSATKTPGNTATTKVPTTGTTTAAPTATGTETVEYPSQLEGLDFGGEEIGIMMSGGDLATRSIYVDEDNGADPTYSVNAAVIRRNKAVEEDLGIKIVTKETIDMQAMVTAVREYVTGPDTDIDIIGVYQYFDLGLAFGDDAGSLYNYNTIEEEDMFLNPEASYWDTECFNTISYKGAAFWITGDLSQLWLADKFVSFVNAKIWNDYAEQIYDAVGQDYTDIYELVYDGKWTLDLWTELNSIVYRDIDSNDRTSDGDQVGFVGFAATCGINDVVVDGLFSGCHVTWSKIGADGVPVIDYSNSYLTAYADATIALYDDPKSLLLPSYDDEREVMDIFADGLALMTVNTLASAETSLQEMTDDYYILPPPKANEKQTNYATTVGDAVNQFGILTKTPNVGAATATLEALGYYSELYVTPEYYNNALKGRYTRGDSVKAAAMIDYIDEHIYSDFVLIWANNMGSSPSWYLRNNIGSKAVKTNALMDAAKYAKALNNLLKEIELGGSVEI